MAQELKIISDFYDFTLWLTQHTAKFPRHHRHSLGLAMENRLRTILALLLTAKYERNKAPHLQKANLELEILRFEVRLATDLAVLTYQSHGHAATVMNAIGVQIGGWLKSKPGMRDETIRPTVGATDRLAQPAAGGAQGAAGQT
jgi:hypothetical protein